MLGGAIGHTVGFSAWQWKRCKHKSSYTESYTMQQTFTMPLSFSRPPLNQNDRMHWAKKARIVKAARFESRMRAKSMRLPAAKNSITVQFCYQPRDNRRRDPGNLTATSKPIVDGLVDAGIVPDDCPPYVRELMPEILPAVKGEPAKCWLTISYT